MDEDFISSNLYDDCFDQVCQLMQTHFEETSTKLLKLEAQVEALSAEVKATTSRQSSHSAIRS